MTKKYKLHAKEVRALARGRGGCVASDRITVDGMPVGIMYRTQPRHSIDSGWTFLAGDEDQSYLDNPELFDVYDVNTIANYDPHVILFLDAPEGSEFVRGTDGLFRSREELDEIEAIGVGTAAYIERSLAQGKSHNIRRPMVAAMWVLMITVFGGCAAAIIFAR